MALHCTRLGCFTTADLQYWKELAKEENSGVFSHHETRHIALQAKYFSDIKEGIQDALNKKMGCYDKSIDAWMVTYDSIKCYQSIGCVVDDLSQIHLTVEGDFYFFKPYVGQIQKGIVVRKFPSHLACLMYHSFNLSIKRTVTPDEWKRMLYTVDDEVQFRITQVECHMWHPYICAELLPEDKHHSRSETHDAPDSGISTAESTTALDGSYEEKKIRRRISFGGNHTPDEVDKSVDMDVHQGDVRSAKKKKKKKKRDEYSSNTEHPSETVIKTDDIGHEFEPQQEDISPRKKKKKIHPSTNSLFEEVTSLVIDYSSNSSKKKKKHSLYDKSFIHQESANINIITNSIPSLPVHYDKGHSSSKKNKKKHHDVLPAVDSLVSTSITNSNEKVNITQDNLVFINEEHHHKKKKKKDKLRDHRSVALNDISGIEQFPESILHEEKKSKKRKCDSMDYSMSPPSKKNK